MAAGTIEVLDLHALWEQRLGFDYSTMHDDLTPKLKMLEMRQHRPQETRADAEL